MRIALALALTLPLLLAAAPTFALEKALNRTVGGLDSPWGPSHPPEVASYFNLCTEWTWVWSDFHDGDRIEIDFEMCPGSYGNIGYLERSWLYFETGAPPDYGYTGEIKIYERGPNDCPTGLPYARRRFLPHAGWNQIIWWAGPFPSTSLVLVATFRDAGRHGNPASLVSDAGVNPVGPPACGTCYPSTRRSRSAFVPAFANSLCPDDALADELCDVEWLAAFEFICPIHAVSVEKDSGGSIKSLYR